jgi:hypothetical protein
VSDDEMIHGLIPREELLIFDKDPEGAPRLLEYIDKLLDNLHLFSSELYDKRIKLKVVSKIRQRKNLQAKIRSTMPQYCEKLKNWEAEEMNKRNIGQEFLRGY